MFFAEINPGELLSEKLRKHYDWELSHFGEDYELSYRFDGDKNSVLYTARRKGKGDFDRLPDFIAVKLTPEGRPSDAYGRESLYVVERLLLTYLEEKESKLGQGDFQRIYGKDYERMASLSSLPSEERNKLASIRNEFLNFVSSLSDSPEEKEAEKKLSLFEAFGVKTTLLPSLRCKGDDKGSVNLTLSLLSGGVKRELIGERIEQFFTAYLKGGSFLFTGVPRLIKKEDFDEQSFPLLDFFSKTYLSTRQNYDTGRVDCFIDTADALALFELMKGGEIDVDERRMTVSEEVRKAGVVLNEDGRLSVFPDPGNNDALRLFSGRRMAVEEGKTLSLYEFESASMAKVYEFFLNNGTLAFPFIQDIFAKRLLAKVGPNILAKPAEGKKAFVIELYVDLDEDDALVTKSFYRIGEESYERADIPSNPYSDACLGAYAKALQDLGVKDRGREVSQAVVFSFLKADLNPIRKVAKVFLSERINRLKIKSVGGVFLSVSKERGWLNATLDSKDYDKEELKKILEAYRKKKKFFILRDDVILMDEAVGRIKGVVDDLNMGEDFEVKKLPFFEVYRLKAQENTDLHVDMNKALTDALTEVSEFKKIPLSLSPSMDRELRAYQRDAVRWMVALSKNQLDGILADDMGLGKTFETIAFMSTIQKDAPILIVCPTSLVYNWAREFTRWCPAQKCVTIEGLKVEREKIIKRIASDKKVVYVTSYDSLRNDLDLYEGKRFSLTIIDEAQYIKNAFALKSKAVKRIESDCRFALTGTPLENRLSDLWSIFDFLMPGYFGSYQDFREDYENRIEADPRGSAKDELVKRITPFILRRTKKEVLKSLPPKTTSAISVNMSEAERKLYVAYLQKAKEALGADVSKISFLAALTKLREICVDASSFFEGFAEPSSKLSVAERLAQEGIEAGHKMLMFSSFSTVLHRVQKDLRKAGIPSFLIEGSTKGADRVAMANHFNGKDDVKVMLVSLKAGGTGLNLMGADTVIHLDPWWNFAAEEQATDRAYRIGQLRPVTVYKLVSYDSVEERVIQLQNDKKELYDAVIQSGDAAISSFKAEDIKFILS